MTKNKTVKRGRPEKTVNFNGFKGPFTIDSVLARYRGKVSRSTVYNKLRQGMKSRPRSIKVVDHEGPVVEGHSHPTYRYQLVKPAVKAAVAA